MPAAVMVAMVVGRFGVAPATVADNTITRENSVNCDNT